VFYQGPSRCGNGRDRVIASTFATTTLLRGGKGDGPEHGTTENIASTSVIAMPQANSFERHVERLRNPTELIG